MDVPAHLTDLADGLPLSLMRLYETWPHLSFADKVSLLNHLLHRERARGALWLSEHQLRLRSFAMEDANPYVRHLGAKGFSVSWLEPNTPPTPRHLLERKFQARIDADPSIIVRHGKDLGRHRISALGDAEEFWQRPHPLRLAQVTGAENAGEGMSKLLLYATSAVHQGLLQEGEVLDVLLQYLGDGEQLNRDFEQSQQYAHENWDGYADYSSRKDIKALWAALPQLTPLLRSPLIDALPVREDILDVAEVRTVLAQLERHEITHLLYRPNFEFGEIRRQYFESDDDSLQSAAISASAFEFRDEDLVRFQVRSEDSKEEGKRKVRALGHVIQSCPSMTLAQLEAVKDMFDALPDTFTRLFGPMEGAEARQAISCKRAKIPANQLHRELTDLRLYALASECTPFTGGGSIDSLQGPLSGLGTQLVPRDPWATYLKFKHALSSTSTAQYERHLPEIRLDQADEESPATADEGEGDSLLRQLDVRTRTYTDQWGSVLKAQGEQLKRLLYVLLACAAVALLLQL